MNRRALVRLVLISTMTFGCAADRTVLGDSQEARPDDPRSRMIRAAGVDQFHRVYRLHFVFNVERNDELVARRAWTWWPGSGRVDREMPDADRPFVSYSRHDSPAQWSDDEAAADRQFINDTFWLLPPLHILWAPSQVLIEDKGEAVFPIGPTAARRVVLSYQQDGGGYTPGDIYELFLDPSDEIVGWHFFRGDNPQPRLTTTFEKYVDAGPLKIALEHRTADGSFRLYFTEVSVEVVHD